MSQIILFNKPFDVLSQFTDAENRPCLADFISLKYIYPAGRLDRDSEGLLILTDEGEWQHRLSHPRHKSPKTYWVQVEGIATAEACARLAQGVELNDGITAPARARLMEAPSIWPRDPPIRYRASIPTSWIELVLTEGKNRQVRRMTAAVGFPTLRLIRHAIGDWTVAGLEPGQWRKLDEQELTQCLQQLAKPGSRPKKASLKPFHPPRMKKRKPS